MLLRGEGAQILRAQIVEDRLPVGFDGVAGLVAMLFEETVQHRKVAMPQQLMDWGTVVAPRRLADLQGAIGEGAKPAARLLCARLVQDVALVRARMADYNGFNAVVLDVGMEVGR